MTDDSAGAGWFEGVDPGDPAVARAAVRAER
jgi:hypothetical protein